MELITNTKPKLLELFAGSRSVGKEAEKQGVKGNYERSKVPKELCEEILAQTLKSINKNQNQ